MKQVGMIQKKFSHLLGWVLLGMFLFTSSALGAVISTIEELDEAALFSFSMVSDNRGDSRLGANQNWLPALERTDDWITEHDEFVLGIGDHVAENGANNSHTNFLQNDTYWHNNFYPTAGDHDNAAFDLVNGRQEAWGLGGKIFDNLNNFYNRSDVEFRIPDTSSQILSDDTLYYDDQYVDYHAIREHSGFKVHMVTVHYGDQSPLAARSKNWMMDKLRTLYLTKTDKDIIVLYVHADGVFFNRATSRGEMTWDEADECMEIADMVVDASTHIYGWHTEQAKYTTGNEAFWVNTGAICNTGDTYGYVTCHVLDNPPRFTVQFIDTQRQTQRKLHVGPKPIAGGNRTLTPERIVPYVKVVNGSYSQVDWNNFPLNAEPEVTSTPDLYVDVNEAYSYTLTATDVENDPLTFSNESLPAWLNFNTNSGLLSGIPSVGDLGEAEVTLHVSDAFATVDHTFTIYVSETGNDAPYFTSTPVQIAAVGDAYSQVVTAVDPDGDPLTFAEVSTPSWLNFNTGTGALTGTPTVGDVVDSVRLSVTDGTITVTNSFNIGVFAAVPAVNLIQNPSFENGSTSWNLGSAGAVSGANADDGASSLLMSGTSSPTSQSVPVEVGKTYNLSVRINASGMTSGPAVFDTSDVYDSTCQFVMNSANSGWQTYGGSFVASTTSVNLRMFSESNFVGAVYYDNLMLLSGSADNMGPMIVSTPGTNVNQGVDYSYTFNAVDIEDDPLTNSVVGSLPGWLNFNAGTGVLTGTPSGDDVGVHSVTLRVSDGALTEDQPFSITVAGGVVLTELEQWVVDNSRSGENGDLNLYDYALNGTATPNSGVDPTLAKESGALEYSHLQRDDDSSLSYTVQVCADLTSPSWSTAGSTAVTNTSGPVNFDVITHTISTDGASTSYIRLQIIDE